MWSGHGFCRPRSIIAGHGPGEKPTDAVGEAASAARNELVETLTDLVRVPTRTPPAENYGRIAEWLRSESARLRFDACRDSLPPEIFEARRRSFYPELTGVRSNLLAGRPRRGDAARWTVDPFSPLGRGGRNPWGIPGPSPAGHRAGRKPAGRPDRRRGCRPVHRPHVHGGAAGCIREPEGTIARARVRAPGLRPAADPWVREVCRPVSAVRRLAVGPAGIDGLTDVAHVANVTILGVARHDERGRIDDLLSVIRVVALLTARPPPSSA